MALPGTGTLVNTAAIALGTIIGWTLGNRLPRRVSEIVLQVLGPVTLVLGIQMALTAQTAAQSVTVLVALVVGAATGEAINIEFWLEQLGKRLETWVSRRFGPSPITQAFVTTSILYVVGPMTILGSIQDGLGDPSLLLIKSALDGVASIAFTTSLGWGTAFSMISVLVYQGILTLLARQLTEVFQPDVIAALTATGGILVMGVGINLLDIKQLRVGNFLPALLLVVILVSCFPLWDLTF
ncbi:MAG: DUF554 domain-containing protein [Cyanobacteriota bacterium]|nr:DUF554 domain-containing protein [Cyanobacteriota bacterium]